MQAYPGHGYKQECFVYDFMKGDCSSDSDSNMQMVRPNEWIPTPPYNHRASGGSYYEGRKHGKESYWPSDKVQYPHQDSWKMDKPSHGGCWPNDKQQYHYHESCKKDKPSHGWPIDKEQHHLHDSWVMDKPSHGWPNDKKQHHHHDSWKMDKPSHGVGKHDGGYNYADDMFYSKMDGSGNGGGHHALACEPVVVNKHYGEDCKNHPYYFEHKKGVIWDFKGIDD
ncbi:Hypothetical predicted protein [Olea europaea subsp. europaea]|uniref:Uncharacterized protein n=1 Tax=Olea europaea subsp. europaea TaxID=158383 RepID=A0A8S0R5C8_OLEEU|nr:Hypothetical predicted protein [Olea europaea subsp. europaea]